MKTQLLITVKNAGFVTKMYSSLLWFVEVFKKSQINVYLDSTDSKPITLTARAEPYELPLSPGEHIVYFEDPKRASRTRMFELGKNLTLGAFGAGMGLAAGGAAGGFVGAAAVNKKQVEVRDNILHCVLSDGDELIVTVKPRFKKVRIKVEN